MWRILQSELSQLNWSHMHAPMWTLSVCACVNRGPQLCDPSTPHNELAGLRGLNHSTAHTVHVARYRSARGAGGKFCSVTQYSPFTRSMAGPCCAWCNWLGPVTQYQDSRWLHWALLGVYCHCHGWLVHTSVTSVITEGLPQSIV